MRENLLAGAPLPGEAGFDAGLRPRRMGDFVGQAALKERLEILIQAARARGEPIDHVLFSGPPGLGKTSLAGILAAEMDVTLRITSGPALERPGDLAAVLTNLEHGDVLFVDEIHRLARPQVEEVLYPARTSCWTSWWARGRPPGRFGSTCTRFTLIGATTRVGRVASPFRDRFGYVAHLDHYPAVKLASIVIRSAEILEVSIDPGGAEVIARRSRGTPRVANRLLRRVRDHATVRGDGTIDAAGADTTLGVFEVDRRGLDKVDRYILEAIVYKFGGGPVGLSTLAIAVGEDPETVEDAYEPFLLMEGLLQRTPRGRVATADAYAHLGVDAPPIPTDSQGSLLDG